MQKQALEMFCKKNGILKNLANFTGKHLWEHETRNYKESLFNKVAANQFCNFTKFRLQHRCFPVKFVKFLRAPILQNICQQIASINERQQETHALSGKKNESHILVNISRMQ